MDRFALLGPDPDPASQINADPMRIRIHNQPCFIDIKNCSWALIFWYLFQSVAGDRGTGTFVGGSMFGMNFNFLIITWFKLSAYHKLHGTDTFLGNLLYKNDIPWWLNNEHSLHIALYAYCRQVPYRIRRFFGLQNQDSDPLVRGPSPDPDPSLFRNMKKIIILYP